MQQNMVLNFSKVCQPLPLGLLFYFETLQTETVPITTAETAN